jgi:hypothetical protein
VAAAGVPRAENEDVWFIHDFGHAGKGIFIFRNIRSRKKD